jgi:predicted 2-oxoglutarate/Fe(II)-dependent dioxygenase YbiX
MKTIHYEIGMVIGVLRGIKIVGDLTNEQTKMLEEAIRSAGEIEAWINGSLTVNRQWDEVREAVENHPDSAISDSIAANALRFIKRDAEHQRRIT